MGQYNYRSNGYGNVGSYQVAGIPFMTGSTEIDNGTEHRIVFPMITKSITVINTAAPDLRVSFASKDADGQTMDGLHFISLTEAKDSITMNVRVREMYINNLHSNSGSYQVFAELTGINPQGSPKMTGSGLTD